MRVYYQWHISTYIYSLKTLGVAIHEMGHYFNLSHTFYRYNSSFNAEHPTDRSRCSIDGDNLCDTPADVHRDYYPVPYSNIFADRINNCLVCDILRDTFTLNEFSHNKPNG